MTWFASTNSMVAMLSCVATAYCLTKIYEIMKVKLSLCVDGEVMDFTLSTNQLDRNYDDEDYAYWLVKDKKGYMHEINIYKDSKGNFTTDGYNYMWYEYGNFADGVLADVNEPIEFEFIK